MTQFKKQLFQMSHEPKTHDHKYIARHTVAIFKQKQGISFVLTKSDLHLGWTSFRHRE